MSEVLNAGIFGGIGHDQALGTQSLPWLGLAFFFLIWSLFKVHRPRIKKGVMKAGLSVLIFGTLLNTAERIKTGFVRDPFALNLADLCNQCHIPFTLHYNFADLCLLLGSGFLFFTTRSSSKYPLS